MNTRDAALAKVRELSHFVGGKHVLGESDRFGDVFNPTTGALAAKVPLASKAEVERAIANAREAFAGWSETSPVTRARVMFRFKELIERHMDELAELMLEAGAPPGVLNIVNGNKEAVDTLLTDPRVAAVSFVGSTPIAKYVFATGSVNGKRVQALGGAKNHMVVMPDADIEVAAEALMGAAYGSAGERCMAISVAVPVTERTANELVEAMTAKIKKLKIEHS